MNYIGPQLFRLSELGVYPKGIIALLPPSVSYEARINLTRLAKQYTQTFEIREVSALNEFIDRGEIKDRTHVSVFTYTKLFLPQILPEIDQLLYLDLDIWINKDITELLLYKPTRPIGAVLELGSNGRKLFGNQAVNYFNAGVLRISLNRLREKDFTKKAVELIRSGRNYTFQDQDIFNLILKGNFDSLPITYNIFNDLVDTKNTHINFTNPTIVHFNGPNKPWNTNINNVYANAWVDAYKRDLPAEFPLLSVGNKARSNKEKKLKQKITTILAFNIYKFRRSTLGQYLRNNLSLSIKINLNDFLYKIWSSSRYHNILNIAFFSEVHSKRDFYSLIEPKDFDTSYSKSKAQPNKEIEIKFIFVLSQPRSGTSALMKLVSNSDSKFISLNELFYGYMPRGSFEFLKTRFPWISKEFSDPSSIEENHFFDLMNSNVHQIMTHINEVAHFQNYIFLIKVFPGHLDNKVLLKILSEFRPAIITLKRAMIFTLVSELKAKKNRSWAFKDNSNINIDIDNNLAENHISRSNDWFQFIAHAVQDLKLDNIELSYASIFERGGSLKMLETYLSTIKGLRVTIQDENTNFLIQDRRTDTFLEKLIFQFNSLTDKNKIKLLKLPNSL